MNKSLLGLIGHAYYLANPTGRLKATIQPANLPATQKCAQQEK